MCFFERELRKIVDDRFPQAIYVGRSCYIPLGEQLRARVDFVTCGHADHYEALRIAIFNRHEGNVDTTFLRFNDALGVKQVSNPNFPKGICPYIWDDGGKIAWYVYKPTTEDYGVLAQTLRSYLGIFQEQRQSDEPTQHFQQSM